MQRVVSINLNGNAYQLEETGYTALFAYLDARETQLQDDPDRAQKIADIEREVAERCQALLTPTKNVITSGEIERIIRELGPIPTVDAQTTAYSSSTGPTTGSSASSGSAGASSGYTHRRLYQVRDGAMISGVCVGLSEYMHIDVTLLRIMFVIFAFVSAGWGILAYGVLMFILPRVATRAEAAAGTSPGATPHHWPWDDGWPWEKRGWPWDHPASASPSASPAPPSSPSPSAPPRDPYAARQAARDARQDARAARRDMREQRRAARLDYHPWPVWSTLSMIVFLMFGFFWLSFWTRGHFFFGWPFFWGFPHWIGILFFFLLLRVIFMPVRAARWHAYGYGTYGPYAHPHHAWISMWNGLAWFLVIIFAVWFAYHYIPEVHDAIRGFQMSLSDSSFHV